MVGGDCSLTAVLPSWVVKLSELAKEARAVQHETGTVDLERLIAVGGSPKGARPKVLIQLSPQGEVHSGVEPSYWRPTFSARFVATTPDGGPSGGMDEKTDFHHPVFAWLNNLTPGGPLRCCGGGTLHWGTDTDGEKTAVRAVQGLESSARTLEAVKNFPEHP